MTRERHTLLSLPYSCQEPVRRITVVVGWCIITALINIFLEHFVAHFVCNILPNPSIHIGPAGVGLIRISGGLLVLFVGPWQFWTGLCRTVPRILGEKEGMPPLPDLDVAISRGPGPGPPPRRSRRRCRC